MNCEKCGGFIGEEGKAYGYAGKWCMCGFTGAARNSMTASPDSIQKLAETNLEQSIRMAQLEAMIDGLFKALNPLLDEWKKLKRR